MDNRTIGCRLKQLRIERGMKMSDLAERVGLSQGQMSRLENGKQGLRSGTLLRIAKALGVEPVYFFLEGDEDERPYGLLVKGKLREALRSAEFVTLAERIAAAFKDDNRAFRAIRACARAILQERGEK